MSRPRFLADHDFTEAILLGLNRREPGIEIRRLRDVGLSDRTDPDVLEYAAAEGLLILSHDVNTMTGHASERIAAALQMPGVFVAHQHDPIGEPETGRVQFCKRQSDSSRLVSPTTEQLSTDNAHNI